MPCILICEDENESRIAICQAMDRYSTENHVHFEQIVCASGEAMLSKLDKHVDLLLLDIGLPRISGMDAARYLRQRGIQTPIIFITSMTQYAMAGYEVHAFGFLKKPLNYKQFEWQMRDALSLLLRNKGVPIPLQSRARLEVINSVDVSYIEVLNHLVKLFDKKGNCFSCSLSLSELEDNLTEYGFFRSHKSFLVNMAYIQRFLPGEVELKGNITIPVSRYRRKDFLEAYASFKEL